MPYRRYRRFRGRKRRRNGRASLGFKVQQIVSKQVEGLRTFFDETRNQAVESPQDQVRWEVVQQLGTKYAVDNMITAVHENAVHSGIGESALGAHDTVIAHTRVDISRYQSTVHFRNVEEHPVFLTVMEIQAKKSLALDGLHMDVHVKRLIHNDFINYTADETTVATATNVEGVDIETEGSFTIDTYSQFLKPFGGASGQMRKFYKLLRTKTFKLNPGDDVFWTMRMRNRVWNPARQTPDQYQEDSEEFDVIGGYSKVLVVGVKGCIGRSNAADAAEVIGLMQADVTVDKVTRARLAPLQFAKHEAFKRVTKSDLTGVTLVGPTDDGLVDDDN